MEKRIGAQYNEGLISWNNNRFGNWYNFFELFDNKDGNDSFHYFFLERNRYVIPIIITSNKYFNYFYLTLIFCNCCTHCINKIKIRFLGQNSRSIACMHACKARGYRINVKTTCNRNKRKPIKLI